MQELDTLQKMLSRLTVELASGCPYCVSVSPEPGREAPVRCTKWSGSSQPIFVNSAACLSCGEYRAATTLA